MANLRTFKVTKSAGIRLGTAEQIASGPVGNEEPVLVLQYSYWTNKRRYAARDKNVPKQSEYRVDGVLALKMDIAGEVDAMSEDKSRITEPWQWIVNPADRRYIYASKTGTRAEEVKWWKSRLGKAENTYLDEFLKTDVVDEKMEKPVKGKMYFPRVYKLVGAEGTIDITDRDALVKALAANGNKPIYFEVVGEKALSNVKFAAAPAVEGPAKASPKGAFAYVKPKKAKKAKAEPKPEPVKEPEVEAPVEVEPDPIEPIGDDSDEPKTLAEALDLPLNEDGLPVLDEE